jgi:hypothetical protein
MIDHRLLNWLEPVDLFGRNLFYGYCIYVWELIRLCGPSLAWNC